MSSHQFTITVADRQQEFLCREGESLLNGMDYQRNKAIKIGCRGGGCGICKIKINRGEYDAKKMSIKHVTQEEREQGFALSCRVYPTSDMTIEALTTDESA